MSPVLERSLTSNSTDVLATHTPAGVADGAITDRWTYAFSANDTSFIRHGGPGLRHAPTSRRASSTVGGGDQKASPKLAVDGRSA